MKVFLHTNVLVSAFGTRGLCSDVLDLVLEQHELKTGEVVLQELNSALRRKFCVPEESISRVETFLRQYEIEPVPQALPKLSLKDHADVVVVASALNAGADILVTGDREILQLENKPLRIVSPREFWTLATRARIKR